MKKYFSIGEVAKIKDMTVAALRFYHEKGILIPYYIDSSSGYRYYTIDQFAHIDIIKGCRELGTSIEELEDIFKEQDTEKFVLFLKGKKREAQKTISKMEGIMKQIDEICDQVAYGSTNRTDGGVVVQYFEERGLLEVPCHEVGENKELIYYSALQKKINEVCSGTGAQRGIRYTLSEEGIKSEAVFCVIEKESTPITDYKLPKGTYLTINYTKATEKQQIEKIVAYIKEKNLEPILYLEIDLLNDVLFKTDDYSCQVQIYYKEK